MLSKNQKKKMQEQFFSIRNSIFLAFFNPFFFFEEKYQILREIFQSESVDFHRNILGQKQRLQKLTILKLCRKNFAQNLLFLINKKSLKKRWNLLFLIKRNKTCKNYLKKIQKIRRITKIEKKKKRIRTRIPSKFFKFEQKK